LNDGSHDPMKRTWHYLNTPLHVYLIVMLPICGLMAVLIAAPQKTWIRASAGVVIVFSAVGLSRGYGRRLIVSRDGVEFRTIGWSLRRRRCELRWPQVRRIDRYIPSGGVNGARYVYVTTNDRPPRGRWEIDEGTFQLQDRPGLLESLQETRRQSIA
jgi:hypothetical protein